MTSESGLAPTLQAHVAAGVAGKVVLVTGGASGIGAGCARGFSRAGARVVVCDRDATAGEALAREVAAMGAGECRFEPCDVTDFRAVHVLIDGVVGRYGALDCLINNAGWHPPHAPIDDFSIEDFLALLNLNVVSVFAGCKFALPHLRRSRGSIINIGSLVGTIGQEFATTYVATKGAVSALTKALAIDESRHGVRVNAVLPGVIATPLYRSFIDSKPNPQEVSAYIDSWQWTGGVGTPDDVAGACLFLASDAARFITGAELHVSGGAELAYGVKLRPAGAQGL